MIDFNTFKLDSLSKLMYSMREYTKNNLRYPKVGEIIEIAYDVYSDGKLTRVNEPGVDLIGSDGKTYESKVTQFKNKSERDVRKAILKNGRSQNGVSEQLADYFIFTDVKKGKACCIPSKALYSIKFNGATLCGHANPNVDDFFLHGYDQDEESTDYFIEEEKFALDFVKKFL